MKIDDTTIQQFEDQQEQHGTKRALSYFTLALARDLLEDIGISKVSVEYDE